MNLIERLVFKCPFCGKRAAVVDDEDGNPGILHNRPECSEFDRMGPTEFLAACNKTLKGRMN